MKILIVVTLLLIFSCNETVTQESNTENDIDSLNSSSLRIIMPDTLQVYNPYPEFELASDSSIRKTFGPKLYTCVNVSCPSCIADIEKWNDWIPEIYQKFKIPVVIICITKDNFEYIQYLFESKEIRPFPFPIYFDIHNKFVSSNAIFLNRSSHYTVLTSKEGKVILRGNPFESQQTKTLFINALKSL